MYKKCAQRVENLWEKPVADFPQSAQLLDHSYISMEVVLIFHHFWQLLPRFDPLVLHKSDTQFNRLWLALFRTFHRPYYYYY